MRRYGSVVFSIALFLLLGASLPNSNDKELIIRLQGEILVLQRQIRDLQESFDKWQVKSETSLSSLGATSENSARTLSSIDDKLQRNQGSQNNAISGVNSHLIKISEQVSLNSQQTAQLNKNIDSIRQALQEYQKKLQEREVSNSRSYENDPDMAFAQAYLKYRNSEYEGAVNLFRNYLSASGQNEKADDANFLVAESYSGLGRLSEALTEYNNVLAKYPNGDRVAIAHFKKGVTLLRLEKRQEGVDTLKTVISLYPNSRESEMARSELIRLGEI